MILLRKVFAKQIATETAYGCVGGFLAIIFMIENVARTAMQAESAEPCSIILATHGTVYICEEEKKKDR